MDSIKIMEPSADGNELKHRPQIISSSGPLVQSGDFLQLDAASTDASCTLRVRGRLLRLDGQVGEFDIEMVVTGTGNQTAQRTPLAAGWILGFAAYVSAGTITDGEVQARVSVVRSYAGSYIPIMVLASGDITNVRSLGLSQTAGPSTAPATGSETLTPTVAAISNPSAGAEIVVAVTASQTWLLRGIKFLLTTSATAANRSVYLALDDGANRPLYLSSGITQAASLGYYYNWFEGGARGLSVTSVNPFNPLPPIRLTGSMQIETVTGLIQAGDQFSEIAIYYDLLT